MLLTGELRKHCQLLRSHFYIRRGNSIFEWKTKRDGKEGLFWTKIRSREETREETRKLEFPLSTNWLLPVSIIFYLLCFGTNILLRIILFIINLMKLMEKQLDEQVCSLTFSYYFYSKVMILQYRISDTNCSHKTNFSFFCLTRAFEINWILFFVQCTEKWFLFFVWEIHW